MLRQFNGQFLPEGSGANNDDWRNRLRWAEDLLTRFSRFLLRLILGMGCYFSVWLAYRIFYRLYDFLDKFL